MKKLTSLLLALFFSVCSSFTTKGGGDVFHIFWNGKQVHQQFVHLNKETKALQLPFVSKNDKLEVHYSHCGNAGKERTLIFRNEKNEAIRTFRFADETNPNSRMVVTRKLFGKMPAARMYLYYRSKEIPGEKLLATINWTSETLHARR